MATVGEQLLSPKTGFQRIDNSDPNIIYDGKWTHATNIDNSYNKTISYTDIIGDSITFYCHTKNIGIIESLTNNRSDNIEINIDGVKENVSFNNATTIPQALCYEKQLSEKKIHKVIITNNSKNTNVRMGLDAIDIDKDGKICTKDEYDLQEIIKKFPVRISDKTIKSKENIKEYASKLVNGERQLLIADKLKEMYLTDGQGGAVNLLEKFINTEEPYIMNNSNGLTYLFACGYPMVIDSNTNNKYSATEPEDSVIFSYKFVNDHKMIIMTKEEAANTIVFGGYGNEIRYNRILPSTTLVARNVKLGGLVGGHYFEGIVGKSTIIAENSDVKRFFGGGWGGENLEGQSVEKNIVFEANIKATNVIGTTIFYGGPQGHGIVDKATVEVNGSSVIGWITSGGSNGYTRESNVIINGGEIEVIQGTNRGVVDTSVVSLNNGHVKNFYVGGEVVDDVTGRLINSVVNLNGGTIDNFYKGTTNSEEFTDITGTIMDTVVTNGDISMLTKIEKPEENNGVALNNILAGENIEISRDEDAKTITINSTASDIEIPNLDILNLLSSDGTDLYFNGKNVQKVELEEGKYNYTATFMNVDPDTIYNIDISKGSKLSDQIVQVWEFVEGDTDITTVAKTFNNSFSDNFYYDEDKINFNDTVCKVKDEYTLESDLDISSGFYESEIINKDDFIELIGIEVK